MVKEISKSSNIIPFAIDFNVIEKCWQITKKSSVLKKLTISENCSLKFSPFDVNSDISKWYFGYGHQCALCIVSIKSNYNNGKILNCIQYDTLYSHWMEALVSIYQFINPHTHTHTIRSLWLRLREGNKKKQKKEINKR